MIKRLNAHQEYNPIRDHINVAFESIDDRDVISERIISYLADHGFDGKHSRVLVFTNSRKGAQVVAAGLAESIDGRVDIAADQVDYYHAGLDGHQREERYNAYKDGDILILVATKAFGMGMDISNIHFLFHVGPSSTFEDHLQEVGRAGRNRDKYELVGFSKENPIQAVCFLTSKDFKSAKDRLHKGRITWGIIDGILKKVIDYISTFWNDPIPRDKAFPLPLDLLDQSDGHEGDSEVLLRIALYWLEKLDRVRLGVYTPTQIPMELTDEDIHWGQIHDRKLREKLQSLQDYLEGLAKVSELNALLISIVDLKEKLDITRTRELFRVLFQAQRIKLISVQRFLTVQPTRSKGAELRFLIDESIVGGRTLPTLECLFDLVNDVMDSVPPVDQLELDNDEIDRLINEITLETFDGHEISWEIKKREKVIEDNDDKIEFIKADFINKRAKLFSKIISLIPNVKYKSVVEIDKNNESNVIQLIYNGNKNKRIWQGYLKYLKEDVYKLLTFISGQYNRKEIRRYNYVDLVISVGLEDKDSSYLENLFYVAKGLGYIKGDVTSLIPMGIELYLLNKKSLKRMNLTENDRFVLEEFEETERMKELRLLSLESLSSLCGEKQDRFIKNYFKTSNSAELIDLLEGEIGDEHPSLNAFRQKALQVEEAKLNDDQRKVYRAERNSNIQVIAGPGSGKTHTLILRVARLIQEEKVAPETILVLAYNRAVVIELKSRLSRLFNELGYSSLIKRLKVFTFHGLCKFCLRERLGDIDFDSWENTFIELSLDEPGVIMDQLGGVQYILVDEFQDINSKRLDILRFLSNINKGSVCVIGDPNQSIYGYERVNDPLGIGPKGYYEEYQKIFKPEVYKLGINYRSTKNIINYTQTYIDGLDQIIDIPDLRSRKQIDQPDSVREIIHDPPRVNGDWKHELYGLINHEYEGKKQYKNIAILCRNNDEVFKKYSEIIGLELGNVRIRIQGSSQNPLKSREIYECRELLIQLAQTVLNEDLKDLINDKCLELLRIFPRWDKFNIHLFIAIVNEFFEEEYETGMHKSDIIEYLDDMGRKDDGHFGKLYYKHIQFIDSQNDDIELVISTMHKVKGLEFDAVLVAPSYADLPMNADGLNYLEHIEEERRLYYVAFTRARTMLVNIKWKRELALDALSPFSWRSEDIKKLGIRFEAGLSKFNISWAADTYGENSYAYIRNEVIVGDEIKLKRITRSVYDFWEIIHCGRTIGQLSKSESRRLHHDYSEICNLRVAAVGVYTYEESLEYDMRNNTNYSDKWREMSKQRGYIYLIDLAGYGKACN